MQVQHVLVEWLFPNTTLMYVPLLPLPPRLQAAVRKHPLAGGLGVWTGLAVAYLLLFSAYWLVALVGRLRGLWLVSGRSKDAAGVAPRCLPFLPAPPHLLRPPAVLPSAPPCAAWRELAAPAAVTFVHLPAASTLAVPAAAAPPCPLCRPTWCMRCGTWLR